MAGSTSHPTHPATVHFPIAFLTLASSLDIVYALATSPATADLVGNTFKIAPLLGDLTRFSHFLNLLGLITAIPAVATGGMELLAMIKGQDLANKLQKSENKAATVQKMHPKMKIAFLHAGLNDIAVAAAGYNWWTRSTAVGYAPSSANVLVSAALFGGVLTSAYLGGKMVYEYGVGVTRPGEGKRLKEGGKAE